MGAGDPAALQRVEAALTNDDTPAHSFLKMLDPARNDVIRLTAVERAAFMRAVEPVLAKYRLSYRRFAPFIGAGPNFRLTQSLTSASPFGVMAAAGVEFRVGSAKIAPSVRFTHWGRDPSSAFNATATQNQAVFLLGLSF